MDWIIVTDDGSGLGWAKKLIEEGETAVLAKEATDPEDAKDDSPFHEIGSGWVESTDLNAALRAADRSSTRILFDRNCLSSRADSLRKEGWKVFGTTTLSDHLEHDREFAVEVAEACGLASPDTHEFTTTADGLAFLQAHPDQAFVLKPNDSADKYSTFVPVREDPQDAHEETELFLAHAPEMPKGYILQERKPGVEVNVECWLYEGEPYFATCGLELKRRSDHDRGEMVGCAGDIMFVLPLDAPIIKRTIGKLIPFYKQAKYTGFADVNVILGDNEAWFLEVCNRMGYSSHPNLFLTCAIDPMSKILADAMDGTKLDGFEKRFRPGFGASITCMIDHPRRLPIHIHDRYVESFYPYDLAKDGDDYMLTGFSNEVGVFTQHGYTIEDAAEEAINKLLHLEAVSYTDIDHRTDLHETTYAKSPRKRYDALRAMGVL